MEIIGAVDDTSVATREHVKDRGIVQVDRTEGAAEAAHTVFPIDPQKDHDLAGNLSDVALPAGTPGGACGGDEADQCLGLAGVDLGAEHHSAVSSA